ncbi:MAG: response regulator, partial [Rubrivivax sp.]|nr:response regulator [Rubrivivax sp.]
MNTDVVDAPVAAAATAAPTLTVLCVDDEPNILSALKRALRPPGYRVLTAEGGAQALQLMETQTVDLIVSDMRMPGMDGAQLLEQARGRWPETVRVLLTGHADMSATVAAINRGRIFRYLSKPWDDTELQAVVRQGLELRALEQDKRRLEALTQAQNLELRDANTLLEQRVQARTADLSNANDKLKRSYMSSIKVFAGLLELRAGRLSGHGRRVADTARQIARAMELPADDVQQIFVAGLLHDIGLIGGSDVLLNKPYSRYDPAELTQYQRHAVVGEQALIALD